MAGNTTDTLLHLIDAGCSPTQALDYYMTQVEGFTNRAWADRTDRSESAVSANLTYARRQLDGELEVNRVENE